MSSKLPDQIASAIVAKYVMVTTFIGIISSKPEN